jgi:hypothetical protein
MMVFDAVNTARTFDYVAGDVGYMRDASRPCPPRRSPGH